MRFPFPPLEADVPRVATIAAEDSADLEQYGHSAIASAEPISVTEGASSELCDRSPEIATTEPAVSPVESPALPDVT